MEKLLITGGAVLNGEIRISGAPDVRADDMEINDDETTILY